MSSAEDSGGKIELDGDERGVSAHVTATHPDSDEGLSSMDELSSVTVRNAPYSTGIGANSEFERVGSVVLPSRERTTAVDRASIGLIDGNLRAGTVLKNSDIDTILGDSRAKKAFAEETDDLDVKGDILVHQKDSGDEIDGTDAFRNSDNPLVVSDTIRTDHLDRDSYGGLLVANEIGSNYNHGNMVTIAEDGDVQRRVPNVSHIEMEDFKEKIWENRDDIYGIPLLNPESLQPEEAEDQGIAEADNRFEEEFFQREAELQQLFDEEVDGTPEEASGVLGYLGGLNQLDEQRYAGLIDQALDLDQGELDRFSSLERVLFGNTSDLEEDEWKEFIGRMSDEALVELSQELPEDRPDYDTSKLYRNVIEGVLQQGKPLQDLSLSTPMEKSVFSEGYKPIGEIVEEAYESLGEEAANLAYLAEFTGEEEGLGLEQLAEDYRNGEIDPDNLEDIIQERIEERKAELTEKAFNDSEFVEGFYDKVLAETPEGEYQMLISDKSSEHHGGLRLKDTDLDSEEAVEQITDLKHKGQLRNLELFDLESEDVQGLRQQAAGLARVHEELEEEYELFKQFRDEYGLDEEIDFNTTNDQIVKQLSSIEDTILEAQQQHYSTENGELTINYEGLSDEEKRGIISDLEDISETKRWNDDTRDRALLEPLESFDVEASGREELLRKLAGMSRSYRQISGDLDNTEKYAEKFDSVEEAIDLDTTNNQIIKQLRDVEDTIAEGLSSGNMSREQAEKLVESEKESYLLRQKEKVDSLYDGMGGFLDEFSDGAAEEFVKSPGFQVEYFMSGESVSQDQDQAAGEAYKEGLNLLERVAHGGGNFELEDDYRDESIEEIEQGLQEVGQQLSQSDGRPDQELIDRKNELKERLAFQKRKTVFEDLGLDYADSPEEEQDLDSDYFDEEIGDPGELRSTMNQMAQEFMSNSEEEFQPNSEVARDLYNEASNIEVSLGSEEGHLTMETWDKSVEDMPGPVDSVPCVLPGGVNEGGVLHYMNDPGTQILNIDSVQGEGIAINNLVEHEGSDYLFVHSVESEDNLTASQQYTEAIKQGIEEYAEDIGVEGIIYNTNAYNEAPSDFTENLGKIEPGLEETSLEVEKKGENVNSYLDINFPEVQGYVQEKQA